MSTPMQPVPRAGATATDAHPCTPDTAVSPRERHRIRWFVAGHVGAVTLVYLAAAWFGDGWAPPPFPPDLTPAQRQQLLAPWQAEAPAASAAPAPPQPVAAAAPVPDVPDLRPPWRPAEAAEAARER